MTQRVALPPRSLQTVHTLSTPEMDHRRDVATDSANTLTAFSPPTTDSVPLTRQFAMFRNHLYALSNVRVREGSTPWEAGNARALTTHGQFHAKRNPLLEVARRGKKGAQPVPNIQKLTESQRLREFFHLDQFHDGDEEAFGMEDPMQYAAYRNLLDKGLRHVEERHDVIADAIPHVPRRKDPVKLSRAYLRAFRLPPAASAAEDHLCSRGADCLFMSFNPQRGYIARVLLLPDGSFASEQRYCVDCLLKEWTIRFYENIRTQHSPAEPFNTFYVEVGEGEYSPSSILTNVFNGRPTGIAWNVPLYHRQWRVLLPITPLVLQGIPVEVMVKPPSSYKYYIAEQYTDFRLPSGEQAMGF